MSALELVTAGKGVLRSAPVAIGTAVGAQACAVALLALSAWLLSRAAEQPPVLTLLVCITAVRALGLGRGVLRYLERLTGHDAALRSTGLLRLAVFRRLAGRRLVHHDVDTLDQLVHDIDTLTRVLVQVILPATSAAVVAVGAVAVVGLWSAASAVWLAAGLALSLVVVPLVAVRGVRRLEASAVRGRQQLTALCLETATAATDLVAYGAQERQLDLLAQVHRRLTRAEGRTALVKGVAASAHTALLGVVTIALLAVAGAAVADGSLPTAIAAALVLLPLALADVVDGLPTAALAGHEAVDAARRLRAVGVDPAYGPQEGPCRDDGAPAGGPDDRTEIAVTATGLALRRLTAVEEALPLLPVDFAVRSGERLAVLGRSGAGKSTLLATIAGLDPPFAGTLSTHGSVGWLQQDAYIFDSTVADNVRIGDPAASDEQVQTVLDRVRLAMPLDRPVGPRGSALSGGERRRLAAARLLLTAPDIVLLDEPTAHLDRATADLVSSDLLRAFHTSAVVVATHDHRLAERCDAVIRLDPDLVLTRDLRLLDP